MEEKLEQVHLQLDQVRAEVHRFLQVRQPAKSKPRRQPTHDGVSGSQDRDAAGELRWSISQPGTLTKNFTADSTTVPEAETPSSQCSCSSEESDEESCEESGEEIVAQLDVRDDSSCSSDPPSDEDDMSSECLATSFPSLCAYIPAGQSVRPCGRHSEEAGPSRPSCGHRCCDACGGKREWEVFPHKLSHKEMTQLKKRSDPVKMHQFYASHWRRLPSSFDRGRR